MNPPAPFTIETHDALIQPESHQVDQGIGEFNDLAAPLHEVKPLTAFARADDGTLLGGAVGRRWGSTCELQQLWVADGHRRRGIGRKLLLAFEALARQRGCSACHLETFSFQAPGFYQALGYRVGWQRDDFPHGIVKWHLHKSLADIATQPATEKH